MKLRAVSIATGALAMTLTLGCKVSGELSADRLTQETPGTTPGTSSGGGQTTPGQGGGGAGSGGGVIKRPDKDKLPGTGGGTGGGGTGGGGGMDDVCATVNPGDAPLHRLTTQEYKNSIQALFPGAALSFDTISKNDKVGPFYANVDTSVLNLLAEQYRTNAEMVSAAVDADLGAHVSCVKNESVDLGRVEAETLMGTAGRGGTDSWLLWSNGYVPFSKELAQSGEYEIKIRAWGSKAGNDLPQMELIINGESQKKFDVNGESGNPQVFTFKTSLIKGSTEFRVAFTNDFSGNGEDRNLWVDWIDVKALGVTSGDRACAEQFVDQFGAKVWRRPLTQEDKDRFMGVYDKIAPEYGFREGVRAVIEAGLQSPQFIYRTEQALPGANNEPVIAVEGYDMASRLSYFLWDSAPDEDLYKAAAAGELGTREQVEAQARRMLKDPKARGAINSAMLQLLGLTEFDKVNRQDPRFNNKVRNALEAEAYALIDEIIWDGDGKLSTLLSADFAYISKDTAEFYGMPAPSEDGMQRVKLNTEERLGILTHPAILTKYGYGDVPIHRGLFVWETFYCQRPGDPPDDLTKFDPPKTYDGQSQREKSQDRLDHQVCGPCHDSMDRIGLLFDTYDQLGAITANDEYGNPVTNDGALKHTKEDDAVLKGPVELARIMSKSSEVKACFSKQWVRFATGRFINRDDACTVEMLNSAVNNSDDNILEIFVALTTTDAFRYRRVVQPAQQ